MARTAPPLRLDYQPMSTASRGSGRDRQVVRLLQADGWFAMRAPASLGVADVVALRAGGLEFRDDGGDELVMMQRSEARLIEVKTTATRGPWNDFGPAARRALSEAALLAGATAWLYHWPTGGQLRVIPEAEWPT
jgi:hypothetical protein